MPKIKTCRAAAKRFKKTGTGKLVRNKAYKSHILTKKSQKRKRNLRKSTGPSARLLYVTVICRHPAVSQTLPPASVCKNNNPEYNHSRCLLRTRPAL